MKRQLSTKKYWYTIEELVQRWNVSETDIIHFMECNGLLPSFRASFTYDLYYGEDRVNFRPLAGSPTDKVHVETDIFTVWAVNKDFMYKLIKVGSVDLSGKLLFKSPMPELMYKPNVPVIVILADVLFTDKAVQYFEEKYFKPEQKTEPLESDSEEESVTEPAAAETDEQLVQRLKQQGNDNRDIAQKLKQTFPVLTPHRIGKLITEIPGITVTGGAYRKRGERLLK